MLDKYFPDIVTYISYSQHYYLYDRADRSVMNYIKSINCDMKFIAFLNNFNVLESINKSDFKVTLARYNTLLTFLD